MLENAQKLIQLATNPIRIAQERDNFDSTIDRIPITSSRMPNIRKEYQNRASQTSVGDFKLASQTHSSSSPSVLMYQQAHKNFRPKVLLLQKSIATSTVTKMQSSSSFMMGGITNSITNMATLMINISKMKRLLGIKVLLRLRIFDLLLQRIELIILQFGSHYCNHLLPSTSFLPTSNLPTTISNNTNLRIEIITMQKINKGSSAKSKKISYFGQLQRDLRRKSTKNKKIQVSWINKQGQECKKIIQPNRCFCSHSFQCHQTPRIIGTAFCLTPGCNCKCFEYVPYYDIKCMCRHSYKQHDVNSRMCKMCNKCLGFLTNWSCKCGMKYQLHNTTFSIKEVLETAKSERYEDTIKTEIHKNKQNQKLNLSMVISPKNDARSYELAKYDFAVQLHINNENELQNHKKKQIKRINEKYSNLNYERQVQSLDENLMMQVNKIHKPDLAKTITPLQLFIRPHRYVPVKLQEFLKKQYQKSSQRLKQQD